MAVIRESTLTRLQIASLALIAIFCCAAVINESQFAEEAPFLTHGNGAPWIGYPFVPSSNAVPIDRVNTPAFTFTKSFEIDDEPGSAVLTARGLASLDLSLNGATLLWDPPLDSWRDVVEVDVSDKLHAGTNHVRARVRNASGPSLLQLAIRGDAFEVKTDRTWEVTSPGAIAAKAGFADDTQLFHEAFLMPNTQDVVARNGLVLGALFLFFAGLSRLLSSRTDRSDMRHLPALVVSVVTIYWLVVFAMKMSKLPVLMGFDIPAHLAYLDHVLEFHTLPDPTQGWSSYHPPLFYLLTSAFVTMGDVARDSAAGQVVYRLVSFMSGLTIVWSTHYFALRFFRGDPIKTSLATAFAGLLPMNLYASAYVSNESLLAALLSLAMFFACTSIFRTRTTPLQIVSIGAALGLAIATKFSGLALVPVVAGIVAVKIWALEGEGESLAARRGLSAFFGMMIMVALVGGWFYLRNYLEYGEWVIWNVNLPGVTSWWESPGFHTWSYYLSFGESLRHPFYAGFHSFWDGIYSTLWGDGLLAGMIRSGTRHPYWNYDYVTLGYLAALPITLAILIGVGSLFAGAFRDDSLNMRIASSFVVVVIFILFFSLLIVTFRVPYYAQAKAFYILGVTVPLSIAAATGIAFIDEKLRSRAGDLFRTAFHGLLGTVLVVFVSSFLG